MANEPELLHFGVKGMRWGHRKTTINRAAIARNDIKVLEARGGVKPAKAEFKSAKYRNTKSTAKQETSDEAIQRVIDETLKTLTRDLEQQARR